MLSEATSVTENLEKASQNGKLIIESNRNDEEKQLISKTLDSLTHELMEAKATIEDRKLQVGLAYFYKERK